MLKIDLPRDPAISGIFTPGSESAHRGDSCASLVSAALLTVAKLRSQPGCPASGGWVKKTDVHDGTLFSYKEQLCRKMDATRDNQIK